LAAVLVVVITVLQLENMTLLLRFSATPLFLAREKFDMLENLTMIVFYLLE